MVRVTNLPRMAARALVCSLGSKNLAGLEIYLVQLRNTQAKSDLFNLLETIFTNICMICNAIPSGLFTPNDVDNLVQEILKMHTLSHPNVMSLTGVCLDSSGGPAVVMPYMGNGSVLQYLKKERGKLVPPDDADCSVV